ncbi:MAG: sortase [Anaerolineae bacterium]|nr:sortase [Anaerolineae bacterium]
MSENPSTQFPKPPELHPLRSIQAKVWQVTGLVLIISGLAIMAWGGWTFFRQQAELANPPARIIEAPVIEDIAPPTVPPSPAKVEPAAISQPVNVEATVAVPPDTPTSAPTTAQAFSAALATPPENENIIPPEMAMGTPPLPPEEIALAEDKFTEETLLSADQTTEAAIPSLADNPLVVVEDDASTQIEFESPGADVITSPPTRIVAESISLDAPVVETGWQEVVQDGVATNVWVVVDYAAGWHENSALPGQGGNIVLSGHHNIKGEVFRYIVDLEVGDVVSLYVGDQRYDYAVNDKFIVKDKGEPESVRRANARWIGPFNEERLTLVTCWPYNNNTHRVIVIARPV